MTATLSNAGNAILAITGITASGDFSQTNNCGTSIAAGGSCTITVSFIPTATGSRTGTLTVSDNSAATTQSVTLSGTGGAAAFFVSPSGNDSWTGTLSAPNSANTDGPFKTFHKARTTVQTVNKTGLRQIVVQFRAGTYFLQGTEKFTATDSGTASTQIVYENFLNEVPVISGGVRVMNWTNTTGNTWKTTLPAASTQVFENLFYNGVRRLRPRVGTGTLGTFLRILSTVYSPTATANCSVQDMTQLPGPSWECFDRFKYTSTDLTPATWGNLAPAADNLCGQTAGNQSIAGDIEVLVFEQFSTSKLRVSCVDTANQIVYMTGPTPMPQNNASEVGFITGNRYLVDNVQGQLTQPGQWFLDHSTTPWTMTYLANTGENPNTDTVIVPQLPQLLVASNLQFVTFKGLTFEHDNYVVPAAGHQSTEMEVDIPGALSFQGSQHITFDSGIVTEISGTGLEFISCINAASSPAYCVSNSLSAVNANNVIQNSAFCDIGVLGIRIGEHGVPADTPTNVAQNFTVQNNVVEGFGRVIPAAFGIGQGEGHDNLYTHNDVYDGYHTAISISEANGDNAPPIGNGEANNTISFNHVFNLFQGIANDGGALRIEAGNHVFTAAGNKILNNKVHDVSDSSVQDPNGYGGYGIYMDNQTGLVDVENNLVYRVSDTAMETPQGPSLPNEANIIKNNIVAFGRTALVGINFPYPAGVPNVANQSFNITNNLFYFDRSFANAPNFSVQGGCVYPGGFPYPEFQQWNSNLYWRTDGKFATAPQAFRVQPNAVPAGTDQHAPCSGNLSNWTFYAFPAWQTQTGEDAQSVVKDPGFKNPLADDFSLPNGSPGVGFLVFDLTQFGRLNPAINPPAIPATFPTMPFNPAIDY